MTALLLGTAASVVFLAAVFRPLERAFPARPGQPLLRPAWRTDLLFLLGQYLLWNGLVLGLLVSFGGALREAVPPAARAAVASQPWWAQAAEVVVLSDLFVYWGHRLQHRVDLLWRFHAVHHSAEHLDWLAAHREHPVDSVYTVGIVNLPVFLLGFHPATLGGLVAFRGLWAIFIHSNVRVRLGPLRAVLGSPELHHWHHAKARFAGNYANLSPLMDLAFGTYRRPESEPKAFGVREPFPSSYLGQLVHPFRPRRRPRPDPTAAPRPAAVASRRAPVAVR